LNNVWPDDTHLKR